MNVTQGGFKRELGAFPTMVSGYKNISRCTVLSEPLKMQVPGEDKGQQSLLFSLASYPLIEIKKHRLDAMKAKQISCFWNVICHMEKKRMFFPKYQQNSRGFSMYCKGTKSLSVDLNLPVVLQNFTPNLHSLFRNAELWNWSWLSLTRCEGAFRFSLIYFPPASLLLVLCPILESQQFEVVECSYDQVQISLQHIYLCTWSVPVHIEHREGGRSEGKL